ncbi:FtsX-like permease family protein, partial [Georgenia ruanii]|nr:FtsX-like permease family protein [Georgenia ruanii]
VVVALAATESRPDLATLAAIGAAPATRKRIVVAQAGTIVVIGTILGVLTGLVLAAALVLFKGNELTQVNPLWTIEVPWLVIAAMAVALPTRAVGAAWLATSSRLASPAAWPGEHQLHHVTSLQHAGPAPM